MKSVHILHFRLIFFHLIFFAFSIGNAQTDESAQPDSFLNQQFLSISASVGLSIPVGDFAGIDNAEYGFAKNGFVVSFEYSPQINSFLYWPTSISYSNHPVNKERIIWRYAGNDHLVTNIGSYSILSPMTGIGVYKKLFKRIFVFGEIQVGWLFIFEPDVSIYWRGFTRAEQKGMKVNAFGSNFSFGFQILNNFKIDVEYLISNPKYEKFIANGASKISIIRFSAGIGF